MNSVSTSKYFVEAEANETLGGIYEDNAPLEDRQFTYSTGSVYSGSWKGGMRHGKGSMTWSDGARYEGDWSFNQANGKGKFLHADGDIYDGSWAGNKHNGYGVYT